MNDTDDALKQKAANLLLQSNASGRLENRKNRRRKKKRESIPYESATSGTNAREQVTKILRRFGCDQIGFMDDDKEHALLLAFTYHGRQIQRRVTAKGWAARPPTHWALARAAVSCWDCAGAMSTLTTAP